MQQGTAENTMTQGAPKKKHLLGVGGDMPRLKERP